MYENMICIVVTLALSILAMTFLATIYFNTSEPVYALATDSKGVDGFNFAAVGDWGCTPQTRNMVNNMIEEQPELILGLGDYSYKKTANCWLQIVEPIDKKLKIVIGNHDVDRNSNGTIQKTPTRVEQYMNHFILGKQFYSFNYRNIHFIAMSSEVPYKMGTKQYEFVRSDLARTSKDPSVDWIIVFLHKPFYSSPNTGHSNTGRDPVLLRNTYHELFDKYKVDIVLQSHVHNYQRTLPISYNKPDPTDPLVTISNKHNYTDPKGTIFTIVGTGGVASVGGVLFHNFTGPAEKYMAIQFQAFGYLNIDVSLNGSKLTGEFKDNDGTVKDTFSITKLRDHLTETHNQTGQQPVLSSPYDTKFRVEPIVSGLRGATDMAFLGANDILVLEKNNGKVQRVVDGKISEKPILDVNVSNSNERGLLGLAVSKVQNESGHVYIYYTEANTTSGNCPKPDYCLPGIEPIGNRLYKFNLSENNNYLSDPKLMLSLPASPGNEHNGGKTIIGPDDNIYLAIGSLMGHRTAAQNYMNGKQVDTTGGILLIDSESNPVKDAPLGDDYPLNIYYAYGIRNSFGITFDSITGNLWDTENGPDFADEINLVKPGFNSGWKDVQGIWKSKAGRPVNILRNPDNLVDFDGKGKHSAPEFTFFNTVGVTAIKFFHSDKFGLDYRDDLFVGDIKNGNLYHFNLENNRTSLLLEGDLADKIANSPDELDSVIFGNGFSGITDIEVGPDGYLYVLTYSKGAIYRIMPK
jgi:glucose/arabinose dehydrogenase